MLVTEKRLKKELKKVLKKMCSYVDADVNKIDFKKEGWFKDYNWTIEQEEDFKQWFIKHLLKHKKMRYTLLRYPALNDITTIKKAVEMFTANYGWTYKEVGDTK